MTKKEAMKSLGKTKMLISLREATLLRIMCDRRIESLEASISRCAGSLYPTIYAKEIEEINQLFKKLTGFPL